MALAVTGKDLKKEKEGKGELGTGKPAIGPGTPAHTLPDTSKTKPLGRKARRKADRRKSKIGRHSSTVKDASSGESVEIDLVRPGEDTGDPGATDGEIEKVTSRDGNPPHRPPQ